MFRVICVNVNGIRSAASKGLFNWLSHQHADVICLQEIRATAEQLADDKFKLTGYNSYFMPADKPGYSGVGIYTKFTPDKLINSLNLGVADDEGRYLAIQHGNLIIASVYLPSGTSGDARQQIKFKFLEEYMHILRKQLHDGHQYILCGDWNIAHRNIDLKNWRSNQKHSGFLPEERAWLDTLFNEVGFIDTYRYLHPHKEQYTWWSNRGNAYANNVGWRIDYQIVTPNLREHIKHAEVYTKEKFSDHAPLLVDYAL